MKNRVICIFGSTASGKSELLFNIKKDFAEVINVDSLQAYKHFNIGTAKPKRELLEHIPHHMIDIIEPDKFLDLGFFYNETILKIKEIKDRGRLPILLGGAAFYFKHILYGLPATPKVNLAIRKKVDLMEEREGILKLYEKLKEIDSDTKINPNDSYRIKRALEVFYQTGEKISNFNLENKPLKDEYNVVLIGLERERVDLRERIFARVNEMMREGLLEELRALLKMGYNEETPAMRGIGYREFLEWISRPFYSLNDIINLIGQNSYKYAKRQMVFFKALSNDIHWLSPKSELDDILRLIYY